MINIVRNEIPKLILEIYCNRVGILSNITKLIILVFGLLPIHYSYLLIKQSKKNISFSSLMKWNYVINLKIRKKIKTYFKI